MKVTLSLEWGGRLPVVVETEVTADEGLRLDPLLFWDRFLYPALVNARNEVELQSKIPVLTMHHDRETGGVVLAGFPDGRTVKCKTMEEVDAVLRDSTE